MATALLPLSLWVPMIGLWAIFIYYIVPYFWTYRHLRTIPAQFPAQFTSLWLMSKSRKAKRSDTVRELHQHYGPVIRIQPNHISIADEKAISLVYGHGNGMEKSGWYDASISITRSIFTARNRADHARKRRYISHSFGPKPSRAAEPYITNKLEILVRQWDGIIDRESRSGFAPINCRKWFTFMSFDITGDLLFSESFGMVEAGSDMVEIRKTSKGDSKQYASMLKSLAHRSAAVATLGLQPWLRPWFHLLPDPFFTNGLEGLKNLMGIVMAHAKERLNDRHNPEHQDWLRLLLEARDEGGELLRLDEITSEALTIFIAAIETVSNTLSAMMHYLSISPDALRKVQDELDSAVAPDVVIPSFESVQGLPYLDAVTKETMRLLSVIGLGLPREIPPDSKGLHYNEFYFPPGTVLSVPIYTIHRLKEIWGSDSDEFKPERFFNLSSRQKTAYIPFGAGPAACVGRNLAEVEMKTIAATWIRRYAVRARDKTVPYTEGTTRKFVEVNVDIKRRERVTNLAAS